MSDPACTQPQPQPQPPQLSASSNAGSNPLTKFTVSPLTGHSPYIKPYCVDFVLDGAARKWHCIQNHDAVVILIYNRDRKSLVLVRQFRPATYLHRCLEANSGDIACLTSTDPAAVPPLPADAGDVLEACAGIIDKPGKSLEEIAVEEVLEECGYQVPVDSLERVITCRSGVGVSSARQTIFYVEVANSMKVSAGGGSLAEGERIEVVYWPVDDLDKLLADDSGLETYIGLQYCLMWFKVNKMARH